MMMIEPDSLSVSETGDCMGGLTHCQGCRCLQTHTYPDHDVGDVDYNDDIGPEVRTDNRTQRVPQEQALAVSREAPSRSGRISPD